MHDSLELRAVATVIVVLAAGTLLRRLLRPTPVPFSAGMLLLGLLAGVLAPRLGGASPTVLAHAVHPDLLLFVFLPALVFESALSLDAHAFWKERAALGLLAAPAVVVSALLVGAGMVWMTAGSWSWTWPVALVFGALISATDPVAVVSLLRDVGAPKRLGLLIEGESLLNDGTSIVVFSVLLALLTGSGELSASHVVLDFVRVVLGGVAVGGVLAAIVTFWLSRTFNDALSEIPLTLVVAYAAMVIAEAVLHVSGVIAVLTCGLWLGSRGRTAVSPEVRSPLAHFWHLLAHVINTLIFFLVGVLIARQLEAATPFDFLLLTGAFGLVLAVRFAVTFTFRPLIVRLGGGVTKRESVVMAWSGLRGAVSLALALIVCQNDAVAPGVQRDILLATAFVVLFTILLNGGTAGPLLRALGFDKRAGAEEHAALHAELAALERVRERVTRLAGERDLRALDWREVQQDLERRVSALSARMKRLEVELSRGAPEERAAGVWVQALRVEREAYWGSFAAGTLGARAVRVLDLGVDLHLDRVVSGDLTPPPSHLEATQRDPFERARAWLGDRAGLRASRLALHYDVARGQLRAAESVLAVLAALGEREEPGFAEVAAYFRVRLHDTVQRMEEMRINHPELVHAVERRLARRLELNLEREEYARLKRRGALDEEDAARLAQDAERRMKELMAERYQGELPATRDLLAAAPLLRAVPDDVLDELAEGAREHVLAPGEVVFEAGDKGETVFVVARGAMRVHAAGGTRELLDVLGAGSVFGEMAFLNRAPRTATVEAATSATLLELSPHALRRAIAHDPRLEERLFRAFAERAFDTCAREDARLAHLSRDDRRAWFESAELLHLQRGEPVPAADCAIAFLVTGGFARTGERHTAPGLVSAEGLPGAHADDDDTCVALLKPPPSETAE